MAKACPRWVSRRWFLGPSEQWRSELAQRLQLRVIGAVMSYRTYLKA